MAQSAQYMPSLVRHFYREAAKKVFERVYANPTLRLIMQESSDFYAFLTKHFSAQLVQREISIVQVARRTFITQLSYFSKNSTRSYDNLVIRARLISREVRLTIIAWQFLMLSM